MHLLQCGLYSSRGPIRETAIHAAHATPLHPQLLDWLAAEFVKSGFSMKKVHRLMVTSETYKRASVINPALMASNIKADPANAHLWHFRLQRLGAEPIWDSIFAVAGTLDTTVGGPSFDAAGPREWSIRARRPAPMTSARSSRRAAYLIRGYSSQRDVVPQFLQAFDVDDGRAPCPLRTQTVTALQALFMMNSNIIDGACAQFAERLNRESDGNLKLAVNLAYRISLARPASPSEIDQALVFLEHDPGRLKGLAWLLFNLDEFIYVR